MKSYFCITALLLFFLIGCAPEHEMQLTGTIDGLKKGTLLLQKVEDTMLVSVDSITIDGDANFEFSVAVPSPEVYYLYLRLKNGDLLDERIPFFAEEGVMSIDTSLDNFGNDYKVTGSTNQEKLEEYTRLMERYTDKNLEVVSLRLKAMAEKNDSVYNALTLQEERLLRSKYLASVNYALTKKEYEIAPYIMAHTVEGLSKKYLDTVYKALPKNIKNSKYGVHLESLIKQQAAN